MCTVGPFEVLKVSLLMSLAFLLAFYVISFSCSHPLKQQFTSGTSCPRLPSSSPPRASLLHTSLYRSASLSFLPAPSSYSLSFFLSRAAAVVLLNLLLLEFCMRPLSPRVRPSFSLRYDCCVQVCAIVGGVFTVLGLVSSMVHSSLKRILKKAEIGKLG